MTDGEFTEAQASRYLELLLVQIEDAFSDDQDATKWVVEPGSSLAGDDKKTDPYQLSHAVRSAIGSSVDHMHAVANLVREARVMHPMAPFTLIRGAIETASAAVWMLSPTERRERVTRRFRWARLDAIDGYTVSDQLAMRRQRSKEDQLEHLLKLAIAAGALRDHAQRRVTSTAMVTCADDVPGSHALAAWRVCSGLAHGRLWASLAFLAREQVGEIDDADVGTFRITSDVPRLAWALGSAVSVTRHATELYRSRGTLHR